MNSEKVLASLGYRPFTSDKNIKNIWAKPWGFSLLTVDLSTSPIHICQRFIGPGDGKLHVWDSSTYDEEKYEVGEKSFREFISGFENWQAKANFNDHGRNLDFSFLTMEQTIEYSML